jgi:hypothetical protein
MKKIIYAIAILAASAAPNIASAQQQCRTTCQWIGQFQYCNTNCY